MGFRKSFSPSISVMYSNRKALMDFWYYPTNMGIDYKPHSLLAFIVAVSLLAYYYGIYSNNEELAGAALPILQISGVIWGIFILLTLVRNIKKL